MSGRFTSEFLTNLSQPMPLHEKLSKLTAISGAGWCSGKLAADTTANLAVEKPAIRPVRTDTRIRTSGRASP